MISIGITLIGMLLALIIGILFGSMFTLAKAEEYGLIKTVPGDGKQLVDSQEK